MLTHTSHHILALSMPSEGREFTRYFSGFPITSPEQEIICYHKKNILTRCRKDIGSGIEVFLCRQKDSLHMPAEIASLCTQYGQQLVRDGSVQAIQVHVPLTGEFLGKEEYFGDMVMQLWEQGYIVVQSLIQTKDFPLIQRSITDPTLLETLVSSFTSIEKSGDLPIVQSIAPVERRAQVVAQLVDRAGEKGFDTSFFEQYDIALLKCDS